MAAAPAQSEPVAMAGVGALAAEGPLAVNGPAAVAAPEPVISPPPAVPVPHFRAAPPDATLRAVLARWAEGSGWTFQPQHWAVDVDIPLSASADFSGDFKSAVSELLGATELAEKPLQPCFYGNQVLRHEDQTRDVRGGVRDAGRGVERGVERLCGIGPGGGSDPSREPAACGAVRPPSGIRGPLDGPPGAHRRAGSSCALDRGQATTTGARRVFAACVAGKRAHDTDAGRRGRSFLPGSTPGCRHRHPGASAARRLAPA
ncbi:hypothetical protein G6F57_016673 [Rhizopus arrhizus]|nr:hypothetical protein G6F57_016673 [Rhizopus arrhizus]